MQLAQRAAQQTDKIDFFIHAAPGGGKSGFILDSYWEKDGKRGGPVVFDFDQGGILPTADDMALRGKVPIFSLESMDDVIYSCTYPEDIIKQVNEMEGFEDYRVDLFSYDTVSSMEEMLMGRPARQAIKGEGIMAQGRKRDDPYAPAMADYKAIVNRTRSFIRAVRQLPLHTIITCHTEREATEDSPKGMRAAEESKKYGLFPAVYGKNRYTIAKYHDIFGYMFERGGDFYMWTVSQGGAAARTKYKNNLPREIKNPKFWDIVKIAHDIKGLPTED